MESKINKNSDVFIPFSEWLQIIQCHVTSSSSLSAYMSLEITGSQDFLPWLGKMTSRKWLGGENGLFPRAGRQFDGKEGKEMDSELLLLCHEALVGRWKISSQFFHPSFPFISYGPERIKRIPTISHYWNCTYLYYQCFWSSDFE